MLIKMAYSASRERWIKIRNSAMLWGVVILIVGLLIMSPEAPKRLAWILPALLILLQIRMAFSSVHPTRLLGLFSLEPPTDLPYEEITLFSRDGAPLGAYYFPGVRSTPIICAHGSGGTGSSMIYQAAALAQAGFPLLLLDLRAHGRSHGELSTFGLLEANDILGAIDILRSRPELDSQHIGGLGVSLGAQALLRAADQEPALCALVLEGLGAMSIEDHPAEPRTIIHRLFRPISRLSYALGDFMAGISHPESTTAVIRRLQRPLLLISCGKGIEQAFNRLFYKAAIDSGSQAELWELPRAQHAAAYNQDFKEYQRQILTFFQNALQNHQKQGIIG